ncbi:hypothetical protein ACLMJK_002129 [Lecanora helva]
MDSYKADHASSPSQEYEGNPPPYSSLSPFTASHIDPTSNDDGHEQDEDSSDVEATSDDIGAMVQAVSDNFDSPYDVAAERPPKLPAYSSSFAKVEKLCKEIFTDAENILESSSYQDKSTRYLLEVIKQRKEIKYDKPKRIGIVGESGVGKSSLINAILDSPGLASAVSIRRIHYKSTGLIYVKGATGCAMTCVITEFMAPLAVQETPFVAEVELFGQTEIQEMMKENLKAYHKYYKEDLTGLDDLELRERESHAQTALDSFLAMFAPRPEFKDQDSAGQYLLNDTSQDGTETLETLSEWIQESIQEHKPENGSILLEANTAEELSNKLEPWVTTNSLGEEDDCVKTASLWPIVRIVRVGMSSPLLERGIIVADLPVLALSGLGDTNRIRVRVTNRYIRQCDFVFLVATIGRVQTDETFHQTLRKAYKSHDTEKAVVLTKIDDMPLSTKPRALGASQEAIAKYDQISRASKVTIAEKSRLTNLLKKRSRIEKTATMSRIRELK